MATQEVSLPSQTINPDLADLRDEAESLLLELVTNDSDDTEREKDLVFRVAQAALEAFYGRHAENLVRELRMRYAGEG